MKAAVELYPALMYHSLSKRLHLASPSQILLIHPRILVLPSLLLLLHTQVLPHKIPRDLNNPSAQRTEILEHRRCDINIIGSAPGAGVDDLGVQALAGVGDLDALAAIFGGPSALDGGGEGDDVVFGPVVLAAAAEAGRVVGHAAGAEGGDGLSG